MKIHSVALIGAGAVGSVIIYGLSQKEGIDFCVIADNERKTKLEKYGITINDYSVTRTFYPTVKTPEQAKGADFIIVATKYSGLDSAVEDIKKIADDHTIIMSLMNGIDSEERIAKAVGPDNIVYSLIRVASRRTVGPNGETIVAFDPYLHSGIGFGEINTPDVTPRMKAISELFDGTSVGHYYSSDIAALMWGKFAQNICYNLPQAVLGVGYAAYYDSEHVGAIRDRLFEEVSAVGKAYGIDVPPVENRRDTNTPPTRFSTLQDIDAKRPTEIDMFAGVLMQKAAEKNIAVPYTEYTYHAIKALEEKNAGKFNY